nr:serine/threonine-protein phosphatase 7 long form homolog [Aegilops tauschii subsp. strangulata]
MEALIDANEDVVQTYARVYMWYVISRTLFADATSKNAPWMWLKALTVFDNQWSRGLVALAYLYRQLDDACCRISKDGCIGGCMLVLSVWSWERLPAGRLKDITQYTNELDTITAEQVEREPYGASDRLGNAGDFILNPMCMRDRHLWLMRCPLICNWAIELHMPHRIYRQFGLFQAHPSEWHDTEKALHRLDMKK